MPLEYATPETLPADTICRVLFIPNTLDWLAQVTGALEELTFVYNWELYGAVTPAQAAEAMVTMFDMFCFNQGVCRVVGEIVLFAGSTSPDARWLLCDGVSLLRSDYPDLFAVIGTTYGSADAVHFSLPDLRDRVPMGVGGNALGVQVGAATHTLTTAEMPAHTHTEITVTATILDITTPTAPAAVPSTGVTGAAGGGGAHNNIQPSLAVNYFIVALS